MKTKTKSRRPAVFTPIDLPDSVTIEADTVGGNRVGPCKVCRRGERIVVTYNGSQVGRLCHIYLMSKDARHAHDCYVLAGALWWHGLVVTCDIALPSSGPKTAGLEYDVPQPLFPRQSPQEVETATPVPPAAPPPPMDYWPHPTRLALELQDGTKVSADWEPKSQTLRLHGPFGAVVHRPFVRTDGASLHSCALAAAEAAWLEHRTRLSASGPPDDSTPLPPDAADVPEGELAASPKPYAYILLVHFLDGRDSMRVVRVASTPENAIRKALTLAKSDKAEVVEALTEEQYRASHGKKRRTKAT